MAKKLDVDPKVIYDVCSCKRKLLSQPTRKVMQKEMQTMRDVWQDSSITTDMPHKKHAGKRFLIVTLLDAYHQYEKLAKQRDQSAKLCYIQKAQAEETCEVEEVSA